MASHHPDAAGSAAPEQRFDQGKEPASGTATARAGEHGLRIATVAGIPIYLGRGWPLIILVIVAGFGPQIAAGAPRLGWRAYAIAAAYGFILFASVLIHEGFHAIAARMVGFRVHRIVASLWGGYTAYETPAASPGRSAIVSVAGPVANVLLAAAGLLALTTDPRGIAGLLIWAATYANVFVAVYNLLPGLPLDGGHLLAALVWKITGREESGLIVAGWAGRFVAVGTLVWFLVRPFLAGDTPNLFTVVWVAVLGAMLWQGAGAALAQGEFTRALRPLDVRTLIRPALMLPGDLPVADAAARMAAHPGVIALVETGGRLSQVDVRALQEVPDAVRPRLDLTSVCSALPDDAVLVVRDDRPPEAIEVVRGFGGPQSRLLVLRTATGRYVGVITAADLDRAVGSLLPPAS